MAENGISREEHEEFRRRMEDEHKRINHRIAELEETVRQIGELTASVQKLALSIENMAVTQKRQGERLEELESRDGKMWRKVSGDTIGCRMGALLAYILSIHFPLMREDIYRHLLGLNLTTNS